MDSQNQQQQTYRIVGIRPDDSRAVLDEGLSRQELSDAFMKRIESTDFKSFTIEPEYYYLSPF
jgi:hypothetical protein